MAITNFGLPFNQHRAQRYDLRTRPSRYAESDLRTWRFEQSEGIRPAAYYGVNKYLPVQLYDVTTEDYVVIPKGRIVSALSTEDSTPVSGIVYPASSGSINVGWSASELNSTLLTAQIDDDYFGYDVHINGLLVPCNGGTIVTGYYTTDDNSSNAATMTVSGRVAVASHPYVLPATLPIGVAYHDWYQDIRGKWLNYRMHPDGGHVLTDWYVEVPYVKVDNAGSYSGVNPQYQNATYSNLTTWREVNKQYTYLTVNMNTPEVLRNGVFVASDLIGNYKIQGAASSMTQNFNTQTVGRILEIDNRWPKDGLEDVQTYPRSGMPGTQTAGMPKFLFDFVYDCINIGTGTAPTVEGVYDAIRAGAFGVVRIQLMVS